LDVKKIKEIVLRLGGLDGSGYSFGDLISDIFGVGSILPQEGIFAVVYSLMKSLVIKDIFLDDLESGSELPKKFQDKFVENTFANASILFSNTMQSPRLQVYLILN
jgi:hypothetical protein